LLTSDLSLLKAETYMHRCIALAQLGAGHVAPNPMVGAVLVYKDRIIGEGYHRQYGQAHAEVNCINAVKPEDRPYIPLSTLYVSLEPCAHFGKTPPCTDLILREKITQVVIGCTDVYKEVAGKGIEKLRQQGVEVTVGVAEEECRQLNKRFFTFHTKQRPYIILKWAQTQNGKMAGTGAERLMISNAVTNRLVHQWRSKEAGILVGTNTALLDNPSLDNRLWSGPAPLRMVLDKQLRLPHTLKMLQPPGKTFILNDDQQKTEGPLQFVQLNTSLKTGAAIAKASYELQVQSLLVEGGATLHRAFLEEGLWDEMRIITNTTQYVAQGLNAPAVPAQEPVHTTRLLHDRIDYFINQNY
jgi:diaminohydroxyphosphoribosylaminopyrimidine deaminase / 5-amino-6-(5-phosphoribosylamino)uracil reductase